MNFKSFLLGLGIFACSINGSPNKEEVLVSNNSKNIESRVLKTIIVDRDIRPQRVYLVEGSDYMPLERIADSSKVSTGKPGLKTGWPSDHTPLGFYYIKSKNEEAKNKSRGWDMPFAMWYTNSRGTPEGFNGLHSYKNTQFGEPASHGCVRLPYDFAKRAFDWADLGTPVIIIGRENLNHEDKRRFNVREYPLIKSLIDDLDTSKTSEIKINYNFQPKRDFMVEIRERPFRKF
jgi:hypothetical protein